MTIFWCLYFSYLSQEECAGTSSNVSFLGTWLVDLFCNLPYFALKLPQTSPPPFLFGIAALPNEYFINIWKFLFVVLYVWTCISVCEHHWLSILLPHLRLVHFLLQSVFWSFYRNTGKDTATIWIYNRNAFSCKDKWQMHKGSAGCYGLLFPLSFLPCFLSLLSICISMPFVFEFCLFLPGHVYLLQFKAQVKCSIYSDSDNFINPTEGQFIFSWPTKPTHTTYSL